MNTNVDLNLGITTPTLDVVANLLNNSKNVNLDKSFTGTSTINPFDMPFSVMSGGCGGCSGMHGGRRSRTRRRRRRYRNKTVKSFHGRSRRRHRRHITPAPCYAKSKKRSDRRH